MRDELLLDTFVVVHYVRESSVYRQIENDHQLLRGAFRPLISVVTLGEMAAFARSWGVVKQKKLEELLNELVVVDIHRSDVIDAYSALHEQNRGVNLGHNDLWIAASANVLGIPVMTADRDFDRLPAGAVQLVRIDAASGRTLS